MGKKKQQQHATQSFGNMVSQAALSRMAPAIEEVVRRSVNSLGERLAYQQVSTLETLFSRVIVLERILMEKFGYTSDELSVKVSDVEDEKENLTVADKVQTGDVVRVLVKTKTNDQEKYQGESRLKLYNAGTGNTIGKELEEALIGMAAGETKEVAFGKDKEFTARLEVNRVSRPKAEEQENASEAQG